MKQVLVVVLALCALPCALGIMCYSCTPEESPLKLCNMMSQLEIVDCGMAENVTCDMTKIVSNVSVASLATSYKLSCGNVSACGANNDSVCTAARQGLESKMLALVECDTTCTPGNNLTNLPALVTPTTTTQVATSTPGPTGSPATTKPTSSGDKLRPAFGVLFMVLFTVILSNPARQ